MKVDLHTGKKNRIKKSQDQNETYKSNEKKKKKETTKTMKTGKK